ncbi:MULTISPECIES: hypothetical protein [unclassified Metabacillus]|uniref:hypothetical protein n=1 Tax=Metabacillus sp. JX24 TaxID=3240759 RepID=UPI0030FD5957
MKLLTLMEYSLYIFFTGLFLAYTGFKTSNMTFFIGLVIIYLLVHYFSKKILTRLGKIDERVSFPKTILGIIGSVFITMLILTLIYT